jgi:polyphosphate glucokinase
MSRTITPLVRLPRLLGIFKRRLARLQIFSDLRTPLVDPAAAASLICHHHSRQTPRICSAARPVHPRITSFLRATPQSIQPRIEGAALKAAQAAKSPRVLVIDVGGTNVKMLATGQKEPRKYPSGPTMTPRRMVRLVKKSVRDWKFDCVSLGFPGPVINQHPLREPHNLGGGWMGFNFRKAFGCPVRIINDAAMQALGSYKGGRMLFLGLGTGLGSAMIVDGVLQPMELAHLIYKNGKTYEDYLGLRGLERSGKKKWRKHVVTIAKKLKIALEADYVVLGGGNSKKLKNLPPGTRLGSNENAFLGGFCMWQK